jgi:serine-type D-Ala-D-Ala carboxypeptidase (penicillin-binding protein 5/6)
MVHLISVIVSAICVTVPAPSAMATTLQAAPSKLVATIRSDRSQPLGSSLPMTTFRFSASALALSLALSATGALSVAQPAPASAATSTAASAPVGGQQLAAAGVIVNLSPGVPPPPAMPGASYLLADMDTGQILVAKAPHAAHLPASTLKTLTALTLIPLLDPKSKILVKPQDLNVDGTHVGIMPGTSYSVSTLLQGLLLASGNDAAFALARANHSVAATLQAMNATAADLGATDTVAKDPSGLDKAGQRTSAYDLALIGRAAMKLPDFRRYVSTKWMTFPGGRSSNGKMRPGFQVGNHNRLIHNYKGAIGIKNGYTTAAKFTFVEAATRGGKTYLVTEMSSPNGDWKPTAALLNWAFAHGSHVTPIGVLVEPVQDPVPKPTSPPVLGALALTTPAESSLQPGLPGWAIGALMLGGLLLAFGFARHRMTRRGR